MIEGRRLMVQSNDTPDDRTIRPGMEILEINGRKPADILNRILPLEPKHPGVAHYLIHTYDYPALAQKGLDAARLSLGLRRACRGDQGDQHYQHHRHPQFELHVAHRGTDGRSEDLRVLGFDSLGRREAER